MVTVVMMATMMLATLDVVAENTISDAIIFSKLLLRDEQHRQRQLEQLEREQNATWEAQAAPIKMKRRPYLISAAGISALGVGMGVVGGVLLKGARTHHLTAERKYEEWLDTDDANEAKVLGDDIEDAQRTRDIKNGLGIGLIAGGGVVLMTSVIVYLVAPDLPERPVEPTLATVSLEPRIGPTEIGLTVRF